MLVELPIFLKQLEEKFPGTLADLRPAFHVFDQVIEAPADTDLKKAVQAQVAVASEHFGGILANAANGLCLPAEVAARNLYDLVIGTSYLMKNPHLLLDFIEFGQLTVYKLMQNLRPEEPKYQQAQARDLARYDTEIKRLEAKFGKRNFWHGRQVIQIAEAVGSELDRLYKTQYKTASAISHGSSYPILSRNDKLEWVIGFKKEFWLRYERESWMFGYLMLAPFLVEVFGLLQIRDLTHLNAMFDVGNKFLNG
jgi:Family of unknown function (DUF5677)